MFIVVIFFSPALWLTQASTTIKKNSFSWLVTGTRWTSKGLFTSARHRVKCSTGEPWLGVTVKRVWGVELTLGNKSLFHYLGCPLLHWFHVHSWSAFMSILYLDSKLSILYHDSKLSILYHDSKLSILYDNSKLSTNKTKQTEARNKVCVIVSSLIRLPSISGAANTRLRCSQPYSLVMFIVFVHFPVRGHLFV